MNIVFLLQATLCLCNIASNGDECCQQLYKNNVLIGVIPILQLADAELVHMALCLVEMILNACPEASFSVFLCNPHFLYVIREYILFKTRFRVKPYD